MASEPIDGDLHNEVKTVTIQIFSSHEAAQIAASNLEAHGIQCWINSDDCGGMYPNLTAASGVRLLVRASDAEAATALLNAQVVSPAEINQIETEAVASAPPEVAPLRKLALWQIFSGVVMGIILCLLYQSASNFGTKIYYHHTNGKADEEWIYRDGHLAEFLKDRNLDGVWDEWTYYEYGRAVRSEYDNNFDGKPDECWTFTNDGTETFQKDTDFNGTPDEFCTYKDKIIQQLDIKPNGSKFATVREIFTNGVLSEILRGGDSRGNFKEEVKYDAFFNPIPIGFNPVSTNTPAFQLLTPSK